MRQQVLAICSGLSFIILASCGPQRTNHSSVPQPERIIPQDNLARYATTTWESDQEKLKDWLAVPSSSSSASSSSSSSPSSVGQYGFAFWQFAKTKLALQKITIPEASSRKGNVLNLADPEVEKLLRALCLGKDDQEEIFLFSDYAIGTRQTLFSAGPLNGDDKLMIGCRPQGFLEGQKVLLGWQANPNQRNEFNFKFRLVINEHDAAEVNPIEALWIEDSDQNNTAENGQKFLYRSYRLVGEKSITEKKATESNDQSEEDVFQQLKSKELNYRAWQEAQQ
ncbi:MAG: hypothetical protein J6Y94_04155 [Bacteriovoracaceae bacterium]|nr:hypothetical protein [Bacteriovoracaceae bacterium]